MNINKSEKTNKIILAVLAPIMIALLVISMAGGAITKPSKAFGTPEEAKARLDAMQDDFGTISNNYAQAESERAEAQARVDSAQANIDSCNAQIADLQVTIGIMAKESYTNGPSGGILDAFLTSGSLEELVYNLQTIALINQKSADTIIHCKNLRKEVEDSMAELQEQLGIANDRADAARGEKERMESLMNSLRAEFEEAGEDPGYGPAPGPAPYLGDVVATARACIGYPYHMGKAGPYEFDCSGLVCWCYGCGGSHTWTTLSF